MTLYRPDEPLPQALRIGDWLILPRRNRIRRDEEEVQIEPRLMEVLVCLAGADGEVVGREELLDRVWGEVVVGEESLTRTISELRRALGDDSQNPTYIETIRKGGYRLLRAVEVVELPRPQTTSATDPASGATGHRTARFRTAAALLALVAVASMVVMAVRDGGNANGDPTPLKSVPLTSYPGRETTPALSPDGNTLAFSWTGPDDGDMDLYVKQIGEESPLQLTDDAGAEVAPVWSPDGRSLVYLHRHTQEDGGGQSIRIVPLLGGEPRELFRARVHVPGFTLIDDSTMVYSDAETHHGPGHLYRRNLRTNEVEQLTEAPQQAWDHVPQIGPDGVTVAFLRRGHDWRFGIHLLDTESKELKTVADDLDAVEGLSWDREGRSLVFASRMNGNYSLWRVWLADGSIDWIPVHGEWMFFPTVAREADRLAYQHRRFEKNIWRITIGDDVAEGLTTGPVISSSRWDCEAYYSPDGHHLAFVSSRSGDLEVWACQADGERPVQLTRFGGPSVAAPCWSPEGSRIALAASPGGFSHLYIVDYADRSLTQVTSGEHHDLQPTWSADGRWLYTSSNRDGDWRIWKVPADGDTTATAFPVTDSHCARAREASDGRSFYFARMYEAGMWHQPLVDGMPDGAPELVVENLPRVGQGNNWDYFPGGLALLDRDDDGPFLIRYEFASGEARKITNVPNVASPSVTISPDGRHLLYARIENSIVDLELVEGFR